MADTLVSGLPRVERAPDLGSVRENLLALCRLVRQIMHSLPGTALRSVIHECDQAEAERFEGVIVGKVVEPTVKLLREVIICGIDRGEVRSGAADGYVFDAVPGHDDDVSLEDVHKRMSRSRSGRDDRPADAPVATALRGLSAQVGAPRIGPATGVSRDHPGGVI